MGKVNLTVDGRTARVIEVPGTSGEARCWINRTYEESYVLDLVEGLLIRRVAADRTPSSE